jgi:hypothetical protein
VIGEPIALVCVGDDGERTIVMVRDGQPRAVVRHDGGYRVERDDGTVVVERCNKVTIRYARTP